MNEAKKLWAERKCRALVTARLISVYLLLLVSTLVIRAVIKCVKRDNLNTAR